MHVPAWLDTALEGGALELQRALVRYRALRRSLGGDWRPRAHEVAEQCHALGRSESAVEVALSRALRRARHDPNAGAAAHLAIEVERERRRASARLAEVVGAEATLAELLVHLEDVARDECHVETAWRRFNAERVVWTLALVALAAGMPFGSWWAASFGGEVPTVFSLDGLRELSVIPALLGAGAVVMVGHLRLGSWSWLALRSPLLGSVWSAAVSVAVTVTGAIAVVADSMPLAGAALGLLTALALDAVRAMWRVPSKLLLAPL